MNNVPVNGELFKRKMLRHRIGIPDSLKGLPGWTPPERWDTVLVDLPSKSKIRNGINIKHE